MEPIKTEQDVDRWLESALSRYGKGEPRTGLEGRVLAALQTERNRIVSWHGGWWAATAAAALAALVVGAWLWESDREVKPENTAGIRTTAAPEGAHSVKSPFPGITHPAGTTSAEKVVKRRRVNQPSRELAARATPKLEQFPSPQPLSEQEQILMSYVANYPETAALIAQARAEELQREGEREAAEASGNVE